VNPGYKLVDNKAYPRIAEDYKRTFEVLNPCPAICFWERMAAIFG